MANMKTWAGRSTFSYDGCIGRGTRIAYGKGFSSTVSANQYAELLNYFRDRRVAIGTSRTEPPRDSVGEWLQSNVTKTALASYVGPILITEGYAERVGSSEIRFRQVYPFEGKSDI